MISGLSRILAGVRTPQRGRCGAEISPLALLTVDQLTSFDLYLWLERETAVADLLRVHQSTVSRHVHTSLNTMQLQLDPSTAHLTLLGDQELLEAERYVHQQARLIGQAPLRIDATYASGPWLLRSPPVGWIVGRFDLPGISRPLQLLRDRVIDAWVGSYQPDLPGSDDPEWWVLDLLREPVELLAAPDHPLAGVQRLQPEDLDPFPSLALPPGWFPQTEQILRSQGLWSDPVRIRRYDPACWEGRCADGVTLAYGHSLTEALQPCTVRLDWDLGILTGEALVVRRDLSEQAAIQQLAELLQRTALAVAAGFPDVEAVA